MPSPGDVIVADIPGAMGIKRRPALVISNASYHSHRPDLIAGVITSNITAAVSQLKRVENKTTGY